MDHGRGKYMKLRWERLQVQWFTLTATKNQFIGKDTTILREEKTTWICK